MVDFNSYYSSFVLHCEINNLDSGASDSGYCIYDGTTPLMTPGANLFCNGSGRLINMILTDLQMPERSVNEQLSAPLLFAFMEDVIKPMDDVLPDNWSALILNDGFVLLKENGKTNSVAYGVDDPLFPFSFNTIVSLLDTINGFAARTISESAIEDNEQSTFEALLRLAYSRLTPWEKAALQALGSIHKSGLVLPLLLILGDISPVDYAKGLVALRICHESNITEILAELARVDSFISCFSANSDSPADALKLLKHGENDLVEFKSTLRWDLKAGRTSQAIERACLKTVSAFLNSSGGKLFIGVRDDGSIEGIETDKFPNDDKFLLHFWTLIRTCLGRDFSPFIKTEIIKSGDRRICLVHCKPALRPVFLRQPGFQEEMYIRVGPSSNALDISEALKYIDQRF